MKRLQHGTRLVAGAALVTLSLIAAATAHADARTQAKRIHDRIAGVPPSAATLDAMDRKHPGERCARCGTHRHAGAVVLQDDAEELGHAVDQS